MCQLLETINITNNSIKNIELHNKRCNASRKELFGCNNIIDLATGIALPTPGMSGRFKCRVLYAKEIISVEIVPYSIRKIHSLKLVHADDICYSHKYADRGPLDRLARLKADCDDILIVKKNLITDTSYSNIVFFDGANWLTPNTPLLVGTKRAMLLEQHLVRMEEITVNDLRLFKQACLINAMLDLEEVCVPVENIV